MRFFLAGIIQGSHADAAIHPQAYRERLKDLLTEHFPGAEIYDPVADHQNSIDYDDQRGQQVFYRHNRICREADVLIAFVPEASMGTAIEMWEAHQRGRAVVVAISPLAHNWVVRFCSHQIYPDLEAFQTALESGEVQKRIAEAIE